MDAVHVIGSGTIGEPLIGLLADLRKELGIDEVTFSKESRRGCGVQFHATGRLSQSEALDVRHE